MARKVEQVKITDKGRDQGKVFLLTEMSAAQAEKWAARALLALIKGGVEIPDNLTDMGFAGLAVLGVQSLGGMPWELAEPLMDEMWDCVSIIPDPSKPNVVRKLIDDDIEEVKTRFLLRKALFILHVDFFTGAAPSKSQEAAASKG